MCINSQETPRSNEGDLSIWYCEHEFWHGEDCPDCDVPSYLPAVLVPADTVDDNEPTS